MKKYLFSLILVCSLSLAQAQTTYIINAAGLTFSPDSISVQVGDTVKFNVGSAHPVLEVTQSTWQANGSTALSGGFAFPGGQGNLVITSAKTYYYICENHISSGMKGRIFAKQGTVGQEEHRLVEIEFFPNPIKDVLHFSLNKDSELHSALIFDLNGKVVKTLDLAQSATADHSYDISELKNGSYILKIENGNTLKEFRFIKK